MFVAGVPVIWNLIDAGVGSGGSPAPVDSAIWTDDELVYWDDGIVATYQII